MNKVCPKGVQKKSKIGPKTNRKTSKTKSRERLIEEINEELWGKN